MAERNDLMKRVDGEDEDRSTQAIRRDIAARRESITETVDELSDRVNAALDWRTYVAEHPFVAVGVTAGLTCTVVTLLLKRNRSPQDRIMDALADGVEDLAGRFKDGLGTLPLMRRARIGRILWSIGSTIATAAVTKGLKEAPNRKDSEREHRFESERSRFTARTGSRGEAD